MPRMVLPRRLAAAVSATAAASLGIYLTHFALLPLQFHGVRPALLLPMGIVLGIVSWWLVTTVLRRVVTEYRVLSSASHPAPATVAPARGAGVVPGAREGVCTS